jgi:uncharacterized protein with PIN domain
MAILDENYKMMESLKPIEYPIKDMGHEIGKKQLYLSKTFLDKYLNTSQMDAVMQVHGLNKMQTAVKCPYCHKGILVLDNVKPQYSGGISPVPQTLHHTSNEYTYFCNNCDAHFFGVYQWMWID